MTSNTNETDTIQVIARFFGSFKEATQKRDVEMTIPNGSTVVNLLGKIIGVYFDLGELAFLNKTDLFSRQLYFSDQIADKRGNIRNAFAGRNNGALVVKVQFVDDAIHG